MMVRRGARREPQTLFLGKLEGKSYVEYEFRFTLLARISRSTESKDLKMQWHIAQFVCEGVRQHQRGEPANGVAYGSVASDT